MDIARKQLTWAALFAALNFGWPAVAAPPLALLTIADGPVQVLRGAARLDAGEGLALAEEDIVRTGNGTRLARIEFADGRMLDLGPATQVLLQPTRAAALPGLAGVTAVLAQGWVKLSSGATGARIATPQWVADSQTQGSVLLRASTDIALLAFAESRGVVLRPRDMGGEARVLREGELWLRDASGAAGVAPASHRSPLREVPRALADTLPRRATRHAGSVVGDGDAGMPLAAEDLAPWLHAEPALLALLRPRLTALTRQHAAARAEGAPRPRSIIVTRSATAVRARVRPTPAAVVLPGLPATAAWRLAAPEPALALTLPAFAYIAAERLATLPMVPPSAPPPAAAAPEALRTAAAPKAAPAAGTESPKRR